jgi:hypothetical protein
MFLPNHELGGDAMAERALDVYLNDHLAGATMGCEIADDLRDRNEGTPLGGRMAVLAAEIESDRATLADLAERLGTTSNPVKKGTAWLAEKAAELKFSGATSGNPDLGTFLELEALSLGVEGKICLWRSLQAVADDHAAMEGMNFDDLIARGEAQRRALEAERSQVGSSALRGGGD